ncbi:MAG TPA: bifunctional 2-methylcitrate dehydratase/aconitate hydratase [Steroidobacteraceae bacterium]|nr:bifunctional 2-methylcitrate dehydratase/aconitate hydratase [Steroidobacteraceae bacterium]
MTSPERPAPDRVLTDIARYARDYTIERAVAWETAALCLMDTLACGFQALAVPACRRLLGPIVPGATMHGGARVPGTAYELDPVQAAFSIGTMGRWLDYNDTWLAAEWGHPSDNLGGILAVADYMARRASAEGGEPPLMRDVLAALIRAYEIQGVTALENSFNRVGLDHVVLVRVATAAVTTALLGGSQEQVVNAVSNAWVDGAPLRTYRQAPNTGSRKGWAAGDATSRGVRHALLAMAGEMGYPAALTAPSFGFYDALFRGEPFRYPQPFGTYVIENILFKASFPAEFHAQTAAECALQLHGTVHDRLEQIDRIVIETQEPAIRIIDKTGPLANPADRDHCLQYVTAAALLLGRLTAEDYGDGIACDPRIDALRAKMVVRENPTFTAHYYAADRRTIGGAVQVFFADGTATPRVAIDAPLGHRERRSECLPALRRKFAASVAAHFPPRQAERIGALFADRERLEAMPVHEFVANLVKA